MPELTFTGERVVPGKTPTLLVLEHLVRYRFAGRFSKGLRVVDVGCGTGYGAAVLAETAGLTVGIDSDWGTIHYAGKAYLRPNLRFVLSDCRDLPFRDRFFEVAVSFEVIEHIREQDQCLSEIRRVLSPDGILIMSTPNVFRSTKVIEEANPFHHKELNEGEFAELLLRHFDDVQLLYQHELSASGIQLPATEMTDPVDLVEDLSAAPAAKYFIAVCGARRTAIHRRRSVGVAGIDAQIAIVQDLRQTQKEISALLLQREQIERDYTSDLAARRRELEKLQQEVDALVRQREETAREYNTNLAAQRAAIEKLQQEVEALLSQREQIQREYEESLWAHEQIIRERETQNAGLRMELEWLYRWIPINKLARRLVYGRNLRKKLMARLHFRP
jgi:SAM-dependent methyltransferase